MPLAEGVHSGCNHNLQPTSMSIGHHIHLSEYLMNSEQTTRRLPWPWQWWSVHVTKEVRRPISPTSNQEKSKRLCRRQWYHHAAKLGKHSFIVLECLFCECSSSAGARVVSKNGCLQVWQTILLAASLTFAWLLEPLAAFLSVFLSRFCWALAPLPISNQ